jgi:uncharacterized membrane protein
VQDFQFASPSWNYALRLSGIYQLPWGLTCSSSFTAQSGDDFFREIQVRDGLNANVTEREHGHRTDQPQRFDVPPADRDHRAARVPPRRAVPVPTKAPVLCFVLRSSFHKYPTGVLRGRDVSRLEGFSDAVFGFVLTLLVVSLEVPESFGDLQRILSAFPAFAATFAVICWVWYEHYLLFRRYGLEDGVTVALNCLLLFIVVFYAYPMKFMMTRLVSGTLLGVGPGISEGMSPGNGRMLMAVYSGGFVALFATFMLLHANAWRQRVALRLDALASYDARASIGRHGISAAIGFVSVAIALLLPPAFLAAAGLIFFLLGPAHAVYGYWNGRRRERLQRALGRAAEDGASSSPPATADSTGSTPERDRPL